MWDGEYSLCEDYDYYGSRRDGAFAQYIAVKEGNLLKVDDKVSYEDAFKVWRQIYKNLAIDAYDMIAEFQEKHR